MKIKAKLLMIAAELLDKAADEFADHGCNDWEFPDFLDEGERLYIARKMTADNVGKEIDELDDGENEKAETLYHNAPPDWWMMRWLSQQLEKMSENREDLREIDGKC